MRVSEIFEKRAAFSFEVFPPKEWSKIENTKAVVEEMAKSDPAFMSVTYGAAGTRTGFTTEIARAIKDCGITPLSHLTCLTSTKDKIDSVLSEWKAEGIENILALRGDIPAGFEFPDGQHFEHAYELVQEIKAKGDFCIGGACYPEIHPESANRVEDIQHLKEKVDAGCEFLTTQMFFDNNILYNFLYRIREKGITVPVVAGIMPVTNVKQIKRITSMSGTYLPERFKAIVDRFGDNPAAMKQAGVIYATEQIIDLIANGVNHIHVYSMNKPEVAAGIQASLSEILG